MMSTESAIVRTDEQSFFGHPKGLFFLAFTEAWERFSFYGMTALLVLYMVNQLFLPGHVENIVGFVAFRAALESITGPLSTVALASVMFGLYAGFVYFTPVFGGLIADRWIGQRNAVVIGAVSMSAGHIAMAFDQTFLFALLLLIIGSGFLKGNISAQVGALYPQDDEARRTRGFAIFSMAINFGAVCGPLLCGYLAQRYGWHYGFGVAGIFMLAGLATYLYGYRHLPSKVERRGQTDEKLASTDWRVVGALFAVIAITIFQSASYFQLYNMFKIWLQNHVNLNIGGFVIPVPWYQSLDALASILAVPILFSIWRLQASRRGEPGELSKIGTGAWIVACSYLVLSRNGRGFYLSMANAARVGVARSARQDKCNDDGNRFHFALCRQQSRRLDWQLLREDEPYTILAVTCRTSGRWRHLNHGFRPDSESRA
jgi:POT family proton-dependent oligopeptide transporter